MSAYTERLAAFLRSYRNDDEAVSMAAYMKGHFPFLGLKNPVRLALTKPFWTEHGFPGKDGFQQVVRELWDLPEREFQYTGLSVLERSDKWLTADDIGFLEQLIVTKSWWDTIDWLASHAVGGLFARFPELIPEYTDRWMSSDNRWLQRTALLFQLGYKRKTDEELLFALIRRCCGSREFFIRKAVGWALREYSKTNPEAVVRFAYETDLSPLSRREALKVLNRKGLSAEKDLASGAG